MSQNASNSPDTLLEFLSDPANFPGAVSQVEVVQTHASMVALAGDLVFKVKKPVNFGFLDFSTLDKRRFYCHEEVRLNRRMCPSIYEAVVPIIRSSDGGLAFGTPEPGASGTIPEKVVDYAVQMRRLSNGRFMDELVAEGTIRATDVQRVCDKLAAFYNAHPATEETSAWGRIDRIRISVDENFSQMRQQEGSLVSHGAIRAFEVQADRFFAINEELLERRRTSGMIRDCHGDLHLDHVHITDERICIYDCIEFNQRFRSIDIANDIAFLAMDLDFRNRPDLARQVAHEMTERLNDHDLPRLLPFYKTYRAIVRGKVAGMKAVRPEVPSEQRGRAADEARKYYQLALRYAVTNDRPTVFAVMGRVGTGKSTQARLLGEALGWTVYSSDQIRKGLAGLPLTIRSDEATRAILYTPEQTRLTYQNLIRSALEEVSAHRGVVVDATFSRRSDRDELRDMLHDIPHRFIEIVAPDDVIRDRLSARDEATDVVSDARLEDFVNLSSRYEAPDANDPIDGADLVQVTSAATPGATQRLLLTALVDVSIR